MDVGDLAKVELFAPLSDDERAQLLARLEERHAQRGDRLTTSGASGYFFFVIIEGTAEVKHDDQVIAQLGPGDFFGETAILENRRRSATVTATTPMTLGVMFGADFAKLLQDHPDLATVVQGAMAARADDPGSG